MPELSIIQWTLAGFAALSMGLAKGGFAGVGSLSVVLMALVLPARESTGVVLPMLIAADLFAVAAFRRHADFAAIWRLMPPALLGVVLGFWMMPLIPSRFFGPVIGGIVLIMLVVQVVRKLRNSALMPESGSGLRVFSWVMGIFSGVTTMLANAAGPVMTIYLLARGFEKMRFVGTGAVFFFIINLIKVPFSSAQGLIRPDTLLFNALLLPILVGGFFLGKFLLGQISQKWFEWIVLVLSALGAVRLLMVSE